MADSENEKPSNFEGLVSGISEHERKSLLNKIRKAPGEANSQGGVSLQDKEETPAEILIARSKEMSIFQRIWLRLKSIFTSTPFENVINQYFVSRIAYGIEKEYSGLLSYRKQNLLDLYYQKITQLKDAADFFTPLLVPFEDNPESFYVILGSLIMPEIHEQIETQTDPRQYPYTKEINNEMRAALLHRMENILDNIPADSKTVMYAAVRSVEWLKQFVKLPFDKLLNKFRMTDEGSRIADFAQVPNEIAAFAQVFGDLRPVTTEILQALKIVRDRQRGTAGFDADADGFINQAQAQCTAINVFGDTVPSKEIACVVYENSLYKPLPVSGGEDWLIRYKNQQKVIFDRKWNKWLHEYKKYQVRLKAEGCFGFKDLPKFPYRPWENVFGKGVHFNFALTAGFLYAYFKNIYSEYQRTLNVITLEGDFAINENRVEFTDVTNELARISSELDEIAGNLSMGGEAGRAMAKYDSPEARNKNSIERVNVMISEMEKRCQSIINNFGKASRSLESLLIAITGEKVTAYYGPLTNLTKIQGPDNKQFRENLMQCRNGVTYSYEIMKDLEALDNENVD